MKPCLEDGKERKKNSGLLQAIASNECRLCKVAQPCSRPDDGECPAHILLCCSTCAYLIRWCAYGRAQRRAAWAPDASLMCHGVPSTHLYHFGDPNANAALPVAACRLRDQPETGPAAFGSSNRCDPVDSSLGCLIRDWLEESSILHGRAPSSGRTP